ncbi:hypothetical protein QBC42DRAFT_221444 [Cladorrhinum samala]|uniref:Riboflavin kinase n=1 Tax=Cladorrhinum samala TaxID=585594 RepID=A0AAV9HV88_9PEZI|nr:hypothetical protein QBC42DRAFT_221444 [Cladorrhinum samala]
MKRGPGGSGRLRIDLPIRTSPRGDEPLSSPYGYSPQFGSPGGPQLRPQNSMPDLTRYGARSPGPSPLYTPRSPRTPGPIGSAATFGPGVTLGPSSPATPDAKPFWQSALSEAKHFAGGLIPHPTESTKHYTILRHSSALVFYRGPGTSVTISIFSSQDHPVPPDRTVWMQQRGFSGDSGMKVKAAFGSTKDWLEVTPSAEAQPHELDKAADRAWQRDIAKVASRSLKDKGPQKAHVPRETHVIRIPEASEDGYFRLHLCSGGVHPGEKGNTTKRKVLCSSPIFRVASTSIDPSVMRGASLTTLPLEVGAFVGSKMLLARAAPVLAPIEKVYDKIAPSFVAQKVGGMAADAVQAQKSQQRSALLAAASQQQSQPLDPSSILHPNSEPSPPFPLKLTGKVIPGTGRSSSTLGIPTANLSFVTPDDLRYTLKGTFLGWTALVNPLELQYHPSIITISPGYSSSPTVTPTPQVSVHIIHSFPQPFVGISLKIIIMCFLRPALPLRSTPPEQQLVAFSQDVHLASSVLLPSSPSPDFGSSSSRPSWTAERAIHLLSLRKSQRGIGEIISDAKEKAVEKVMGRGGGGGGGASEVVTSMQQKLGVRVSKNDGGEGAAGFRDEIYGKGGYWVKR